MVKQTVTAQTSHDTRDESAVNPRASHCSAPDLPFRKQTSNEACVNGNDNPGATPPDMPHTPGNT